MGRDEREGLFFVERTGIKFKSYQKSNSKKAWMKVSYSPVFLFERKSIKIEIEKQEKTKWLQLEEVA